jgi:hypothetical protein
MKALSGFVPRSILCRSLTVASSLVRAEDRVLAAILDWDRGEMVFGVARESRHVQVHPNGGTRGSSQYRLRRTYISNASFGSFEIKSRFVDAVEPYLLDLTNWLLEQHRGIDRLVCWCMPFNAGSAHFLSASSTLKRPAPQLLALA